jgi:hypothetical protein
MMQQADSEIGKYLTNSKKLQLRAVCRRKNRMGEERESDCLRKSGESHPLPYSVKRASPWKRERLFAICYKNFYYPYLLTDEVK